MIIGPNAVILGYVLKSIPNHGFSMARFNDRLRLQKLIYLVEAFGVYLGYDFSWYLRGPYCTSLARAGFELEQIMGRIPDDAEAKFLKKDVQERFDRCIKFIGSIMDSSDDLERLEIAASIHLLAKNPDASPKDIFARVVSKMSRNEAKSAELLEMCKKMWDALSRHSLLPDRRKNASESGDQTNNPGIDNYSIKSAPPSIDHITDSMIEKQQYGDAAIAVTLKDMCDHDQALEPNRPPAFTHSPNRIAQLVSDSKRNEILDFVMRQYW